MVMEARPPETELKGIDPECIVLKTTLHMGFAYSTNLSVVLTYAYQPFVFLVC